MTTEATATPVDGRTRRRRRNVDAVIDAVIELAAAGHIDPTSEEIAAVAGISHRSIYRYFDTRGELLEAAVVRAFETASAEVFDDERLDGSFDERVDRFVSARLEIHRRLRSIARVAEAHASESSTGLERARSALRTRLADSFAGEFDQLEPEDRHLAVPMVDAAFQFQALEYLSSNAGLDDRSIRKSLARHLRAHLRPV
ncbi:MAG: TetR/AcrR family transcriptional regulator [Ilumatobacter sp.]|uniref:TetR family transcriptional regulator n=1 Tax=Ilumatobacter sp. TaxID=1967498 RepID=UPI003C768E7F